MNNNIVYYIALIGIGSATVLGAMCITHGIDGVVIKAAYGLIGVSVGGAFGYAVKKIH